MNYEEAIKHIKPIAESSRDVSGIGLFEPRPITVALEMAIEALEKQMPKKATKGKYGHTECACCGWIVESFCGDTVQYLFCPNCGQAIDWSDDECD